MPLLKLNPKPKKTIFKSSIKSPQKIPKVLIDISKNKIAIQSALQRVNKELPQSKIYYKEMLDVVSNSTKDIDSARNILKTEKISESKINEILDPIESKREEFLKKFNDFLRHSIESQNNKSLRDFTMPAFTKAHFEASEYRKLKADLISKIVKLATKSK